MFGLLFVNSEGCVIHYSFSHRRNEWIIGAQYSPVDVPFEYTYSTFEEAIDALGRFINNREMTGFILQNFAVLGAQ